MSRQLERVAPWFGAALLIGAFATGWLVSVGSGVLVVAAGLIITILVCGYLAVDALLSEGEDLSSVADVAQSELLELEREKQSILGSIRDLENERDLGKISPTDFESLDAFFRKRAIDVMKKIDRDLSSWRKRAESMVAERIEQSRAKAPAPTATAKAARAAAAPAAPERAVEPEALQEATLGPAAGGRVCGACETLVDADSNFCKKCGKRVTCACGAPLDADSNFCKKCGAKVESHA